MRCIMKLSELKPGMQGIIEKVAGEGALRRHLLDMGLTPKTPIYVRKVAPMGDPMELCLRGYELTLRISEADNVHIKYEEAETMFCSGSCAHCHTHRKEGSSNQGNGRKAWGRNK
jgi:ferrous iron transport protein A